MQLCETGLHEKSIEDLGQGPGQSRRSCSQRVAQSGNKRRVSNKIWHTRDYQKRARKKRGYIYNIILSMRNDLSKNKFLSKEILLSRESGWYTLLRMNAARSETIMLRLKGLTSVYKPDREKRRGKGEGRRGEKEGEGNSWEIGARMKTNNVQVG